MEKGINQWKETINGCGTAPGKLVCDLSFTDHELGAGKHRELLTILPPTWELIIIWGNDRYCSIVGKRSTSL